MLVSVPESTSHKIGDSKDDQKCVTKHDSSSPDNEKPEGHRTEEKITSNNLLEEMQNNIIFIKQQLSNEDKRTTSDWDILFSVVRRLFLIAYIVCNVVSIVVFMPRSQN